MPRKCSIYGCKSNYSSERNKKSITTFTLPKNEALREEWLRRIPTDLSMIKTPIICIKHFTENSVIHTKAWNDEGKIVLEMRSRPKLCPGAVPTIFFDVPSYLRKPGYKFEPTIEMEPEIEIEREPEIGIEREPEIKIEMEPEIKIERESEPEIEFETENLPIEGSDLKTFKCLCDIQNYCNNNLKHFNENWVLASKEESLTLCLMNMGKIPCVVGSVIIHNDLSYYLCKGSCKISKKLHPTEGSRITISKEMDILLVYMEQICKDEQAITVHLTQIIKFIRHYFSDSKNIGFSQLEFICEQLKLCDISKPGRRYPENTLKFAYSTFEESPNAYTHLYNSNFLCIPSPSYLRRFYSNIKMDETTE